MTTQESYVEICADEKTTTAIGVLERAVAWFAERGVIVERVLSDNGSCYCSYAWREACAALGISHKGPSPTDPGPRKERTLPPDTGGRMGRRQLL
jgi:hypothetical protein